MTNTSKLQGKMREKGYTIETLATEMKISRTALFNKIHNKKEFLMSEVQSIKSILGLDYEEFQSIFFANYVECKSTTENWGFYAWLRNTEL